MKLHEIIEANKDPQTAILWEKIAPYKKSLYVYLSNSFPEEWDKYDEPILMVTDVMNACQYCKIVPSSQFVNAILDYWNGPEDEDYLSFFENVSFNSRFLKDTL